MWFLIGLVTVFVMLFGLALASVSGEAEEHERLVAYRRQRDAELHERYWEFIETHGRAPTTRELWDACPPA